MKNYLADFTTKIKNAFFVDELNRNLLLSSIIFAVLDWIIWRTFLSDSDLFVYAGFGLYPVEYLAIILVINTFMAFFAYDKEKEISYLLLSSDIFLCFLTLCLEIFYLFNKIR